ncbi:hypothetical protein CW751_10730 [Brumimicrobium salinarum]|uniref:DUF4783 domain-containing protein n=1 Tax=Brumimicrobium salinarum TaxID=2058658 RepID=A0A2I0R166_9FLAO|nr:DUF4783 domain-containing protein [Brumimicrobium salinarum]PKR80318.1 hypothetical protein CW751_10730 [Brumimicrobium salinarum]
MNYIVASFFGIYFMLMSILAIPYNDVQKAFEQGNASKIVSYGTAKLLISINGKEGVYSKSQGTQVLSGFFKKHPPNSFTFNFKGKEEGASSFAVGEYQSKEKFRVSLKFKNVKKQHQIESITISSSYEK